MKIFFSILFCLICFGTAIGFFLWYIHENVDDSLYTESVVRGEVRSRSRTLGNFQIKPQFCRSGGRFRFGGASLYASTLQQGEIFQPGLIQVKYIGDRPDDTRDYEVRIIVPGSCRDPEDHNSCKPFTVRRRHCSRFEIHTKQGRRISRRGMIYENEGYARLSCKMEDGTTIEADLRFEKCD